MKFTGPIYILAALFVLLALPTAEGQEKKVRIHLKNGNFMDGTKVVEGRTKIVLDVPFGTLTFSKEEVTAIEYMDRERLVVPVVPSVVEKPPEIEKPPSTPDKPDVKDPVEKPPVPDDARNTRKQPNPDKPDPGPPQTDEELMNRMLEASDDDRSPLLDQVVQKGEAMAVLLIQELNHLGGEKAYWAINALARIRSEKAVAPISKRINDANPQIRTAVISALVVLKVTDMIPDIRLLLEDKEPTVRMQAIEALATGFGDKESLESIARLMLDNEQRVSASATQSAMALAKKNDQVARLIDLVMDMIEDANEPTQSRLIRILGQMSTLFRFTERDPKNPQLPEDMELAKQRAEKVVELLSRFLSSDSKDVRADAAITMGELGVKSAVDPLLERLSEEAERWNKIQICTALERLKDQRVVPHLIALLRDEDTEIQQAASRSLMSMTKQPFGLEVEKWEAWWKSVSEK